jgi:hypothetical protein
MMIHQDAPRNNNKYDTFHRHTVPVQPEGADEEPLKNPDNNEPGDPLIQYIGIYIRILTVK